MIKRTVLRVYHGVKKIRDHVELVTSVKRNYLYNIDSPRGLHQADRKLLVDGWIIHKHAKPFRVRVRNNAKVYDATMGAERIDVSKTHAGEFGDRALFSGFWCELEFEDGDITIEIDEGHGFKKLDEKKVRFGIDKVPSYYYNKNLAWRAAEHQNLIENRKGYYYEPSVDGVFKRAKNDPRLMALYLPQYHPIPENNIAWGNGFTEWNNVAAGQPRFIGHQQPILPSDLGYYDLRVEGKMLEQIEMAKKYGIYGFQFYYYWFSGKKVMDMPINTFLQHKEWDFKFSICWANENWTKRWDGRDTDIIVAQEYKESDPLNFIKDVEDILNDSRYVQYDGKPILTVYRASQLKDPARYAKVWRDYFKNKYDKELYLITCMSFDDKDPKAIGFDAAMDFAPLSAFFKHDKFSEGMYPYITVDDKLLDINFEGVVADYRTIATTDELINCNEFKTFGCVAPAWDNDARKKGKGFIYTNSGPDIYASWLERTIQKYSENDESPIIYINAWNEWAEGAILEPTQHMGYAILNRTAETLAKYSKNESNLTAFPAYGINRSGKKLAVILHLFHADMWPTIFERLKLIEEPYDLFVNMPEKHRDFKVVAPQDGVNVYSYVLPNRGRDVLPFLFMLRRVEALGYELVLKIHTKKSSWRDDGAQWFDELLSGLLPNKKITSNIVGSLDISRDKIALIGPADHIVSLKRHMGSNDHILRHMLIRSFDKKASDVVLANPEKYPFVGGTMFWARVDMLRPLLNLQLLPDDFQSEHGQIDGTLAHAIERYIGIISQLDGNHFSALEADGTMTDLSGKEFADKYQHAP